MISKEKMYVSDIPIENENEDILDRKEFVNALADSLINYQAKDLCLKVSYGIYCLSIIRQSIATVYRRKIIYYCEYLEGGLTKSGRKLLMNNPLGLMAHWKTFLFQKLL